MLYTFYMDNMNVMNGETAPADSNTALSPVVAQTSNKHCQWSSPKLITIHLRNAAAITNMAKHKETEASQDEEELKLQAVMEKPSPPGPRSSWDFCPLG